MKTVKTLLVSGLLIATMRISPVASLRAFATAYTELFRNVPLTLIFLFMVFVLPLINPKLPPYEVLAVVALAVVAVGPGTCIEAAIQKTSQALTSRLETLRQPICGGRSF